jgi:hypothetical protein
VQSGKSVDNDRLPRDNGIFNCSLPFASGGSVKRLAFWGLVVLLGADAVATGAAADNGTIRVTEPPRQFRSGPSVHGPVTVTYEPSMTRMKTVLCPSFRFSTGILFGCVNIQTGRGCAITLWAGLHRAPALRAAIEAHERAHCRGWGADHAGAITRTYNVGRSFIATAREEQNPETASAR